jgi:hypothetical protein
MEVEMNSEKKEIQEKKEQKLSYEELNNVVAQQSAQIQRMGQELQQAGRRLYEQDFRNTLAELDLRIRLLEFEDVFHSQFIEDNVSRIEELLTIKEENKEENSEEE